MKHFLLAALFALFLSWNPNTETDLAGYKVYYSGPVDTVTSMIDVGNVTVVSFADLGIPERRGYSFFVTAYDTSDNESGPSNMIVDKRTGPKFPKGLSIIDQ